MDNAMFSEISPDIKKEVEGDFYLDDKVLVSETTVNIDPICTDIKLELSQSNAIGHNTIMVSYIKQELPSSDPNLYDTIVDDNIKMEIDVADGTKIKVDNKQLFCNNCNEYYEEYCTKCGMLICILNGNGLNNTAEKEIPADVLEIKEGLFGHTGIFALKTIPKGVRFGPFTGFSTAESPWMLKGGKFVVGKDQSEFLNWMQYVNCARSASDQNLYAFQYEDNLYYSSICEIQAGEELLMYFGEEYDESLNKNIEMYFIPPVETDANSVFACTYCCLGFSLKVYLVEHKTICSNGTNGIFEELVQCPFCKIYLEKEEYMECHKIYCCNGDSKHCVLPVLDDHTLGDEKSLSPVKNTCKKLKLTHSKNHANRRYEAKMFRCGICYKRFKKKESLKQHVENIHIIVKQKRFKCLKCKFQTNNKYYIKLHMKSTHLKEYDYNCMKCEYKTNKKAHLVKHMKTQHLKEYDYNCVECEYKTNNRAYLKRHIKTQHLKVYNYNCVECEYKTTKKRRLQEHMKTKHFKEYDYNCMECEYKTNNRTYLKEHVKIKHLKEYDYNCSECEYKTNYKENLQRHIKTKHLKEYDYNCVVCKYKTNIRSNLKRHMKTKHLKEFDYNCSECVYKTNTKKDLRIHVKTKHLKEYDLDCMECGYKTSNRTNLRVHIKTKHLKEGFNCEECGYKTYYKSVFAAHMKNKHL